MTDLRYPVGEFELPGKLPPSDRLGAIREIAETPSGLRSAVDGLTNAQLDTPYRPGGWTVRQVVHHLPDSHMNSYVRLKLALSEEVPTIRTYDEAAWAELPDAAGPVEASLARVERHHARGGVLCRRLRHPDLGEMGVDELLAFYAWHGKHHIAHITRLRDREGW
jgi:hypothetical protein